MIGREFEEVLESCGFVRVEQVKQVTAAAPHCRHCHDQGEIFTGRYTDQGYWQPPEPIMEPCPHCEEERNEAAEEKH